MRRYSLSELLQEIDISLPLDVVGSKKFFKAHKKSQHMLGDTLKKMYPEEGKKIHKNSHFSLS